MSDAAYLLLEDGVRLDGFECGATGPVTGEVVFNTSMTGYQESVTDPSYRGQIIVFTYPLIGNYGVRASAMESTAIHARAVVMREAINDTGRETGVERKEDAGWIDWMSEQGLPGITGINTRALVRHIRDKGAMRGGIFPSHMPVGEARALIDAEPSMKGQDLACEVTPGQPVILDPANPGPRVIAIDTGIKSSIVRNLRQRGARVELHPCQTTADALLERDPDMIFLANGPGDPAALDHIVATVRELVGKKPVFGICLGHQLLCRAVGLDTYKLPFGHRGANHPVKDLATGQIDITSQNHGFAVDTPDRSGKIAGDKPVRWDTDFGVAELSHLNLYDGTVEGLVLKDVPGATVQYHPEAGPGPHDALYLFDRFLALAEASG